ncbi:MAG: leukotoxin LktA family filamentous adhesin [Selenomonas sp.]|nr:leukotoxin LktA family filamentous adhesin [Selenomonas sp.]
MSAIQKIKQRKALKLQYSARLAAALATGLFLSFPVMPLETVYAQNIEKKSGETFNDKGISDIYADKVINNAAVNAFKNFDLDKGNIANMHFGKADNPNAAARLFNFVDNQVNINGTVNAIRNNAIGGDMYFLSPNGVVVGASGVINAGSVHMAAPSQDFYKEIVGSDGVADKAFSQRLSMITNGELPLNPAGTITVSGKINAVDGISVRAGIVNIKENAAIVNRDKLDYANLVNVSGVSAGLGSNLVLQKSKDGSGAITVAAVGDTTNQWNIGVNNLDSKVTVEKNASITGDGDVTIKAEARNKASQMVTNISSEVDVDGKVTGKTVDIAAITSDVFAVARGDDFTQVKNMAANKQINLPQMAADAISLIGIDAAVAVHHTKATVNIRENAVITAAGQDVKGKKALNIRAESSLTGGIATNPGSFTGEILDLVKDHIEWKQGAQNTSVGVAVLDNDAVVKVEGKLVTTDNAGGVDIRAKAPLGAELDVKNDLTNSQNAFLELGVGVAVTDNNSAVNLERNARLTEIKGGFAAAAETENKLKVAVSVKGKDNASIGTSVAVVNHDSGAVVKNDAVIKASTVSLTADNNIKKNAIKAANKLGSSQGGLPNTGLLTSAGEYMDKLKVVAIDNIMGGESEKANPLFEHARELFNVGASVAVVNEKNTAEVKMTANTNIDASGDVNINSAVKTDSTKINASGSAGNAAQHKIDDKHSESKQIVKVQASAVVADIENNAYVTIEDGTAAQHAVVRGQNVNFDTENTFTYSNIEDLKKALKDAATAKKLREAGGNISKDYDKLCEAYDNYKNDTSTFSKLTEAAVKLLDDLSDAKAGLSDVLSIKDKLMDFINPSSYANFSVAPQTIGGKKDGEKDKDNSKFAVAGAADLVYLTDNSRINLGKNAAVTASEKADFKARLTRTDTSINGVLGMMNTGDQNAVGGIFSRYSADREAFVNFDEGVSVEAKGDIAAVAVKDTRHLSVAAGAGQGGNAGIVAMVSMVSGTDNAKVNVADDVKLTSNKGNLLASGNTRLQTENNSTITNVAGSLGIGTAAGVGASVALTNVDRNSLLTMGRAGVTAGSADFSALQGGMINSAAVAGGVVSNDDSSDVGKFAKFTNWLDNTENKIGNVCRELNDKTKTIIPEKLKSALDIKDNKLLKTDNVAKNPQEGQDLPEFSIGAAGSAAINIGDTTTKAAIDGAVLKIGYDVLWSFNPKNLAVLAKDTSFIGAWGGAAGIAWNNNTGANNQNNRSVGVGGAAGWNSGTNTVTASIRNSKVDAILDNCAEKSGAIVGAGLGLAIAKGGSAGGSSTSVAASLSVADIENHVTAELVDNEINRKEAAIVLEGNVANRAYDSDTLVTGGVNASIAKGQSSGTALGGSVTMNRAANHVHADIKGGSINAAALENSALTKITEVGAGIGVSVAASEGATYGFEGVAAYNGLKNDVRAVIDGTDTTAQQITVLARDVEQGIKAYDSYIENRGLDAAGTSYAENLSDALDKDAQNALNADKGNKIIAGALGVAMSTGSSGGSAAAAISIEEIDNDFTAEIKNTDRIKVTGANGANVQAKSGTLALGIGAGVGVPAKSWGGAGSFSWQTTQNDVKANVENVRNLTTDKLTVKADSLAKEINVAGQVSVGKTAVGLAGTYNELNNNTKALVTNSVVQANSGLIGTDFAIAAENTGSVYAVAAGVTAARDALAVNGAVAVNLGKNDLAAKVDRSTFEQVKTLNLTTTDTTNKLAIAGGVTGSKGVAVGGALAFNGIGDKERQTNTAALTNSNLTGIKASQINVTAKDTSSLTTVGTGVAFSLGKVSVQGAAAVGLSNKDVTALLENSNVNKNAKPGTATTETQVRSETTDKFITTADVVSVGQYAAIGAGVAVTNDNTMTAAEVKGGQIYGRNIGVNADGLADITTIGVGGGVNYGTGLGATGSVAVNNIGTKTYAHVLDSAKVRADEGTVLINAMSDEKIANYAGSLSISVTGAAIGASVSVNRIHSDVEAKAANNVELSGTGTGSQSAKDTVDDKDINNSCVDNTTFDSLASLREKRKTNAYKGVAVTASGTHTIKSFLANAGVAATGAAINGTINVNDVGGSTKAVVEDNSYIGSSQGAATIAAHDYTNTAGLVGTVNFAGTGAGIGLGSDTNKVSRLTEAGFAGKENARSADVRSLNIEAAARQGISSLTAGVSAAGIGAGIANSTSVTLLNGKTRAWGKNLDVTTDTLTINADHKSNVNMTGFVTGIAASGKGVAAAIGVVKDEDTTEAIAENVKAAALKGQANVKAVNTQNLTYTEIGAGLAGVGAGGAGSIGVANVGSTVNANVIDSDFGNENNYAEGVDITADNTINFNQRAGVGSLGGLGGGLGVGVSINNIDSRVSTGIRNSRIYAKGVNIKANENRSVDQLAANVGVGGYAAGGANVLVTTVGREMSSNYGDENNKAEVNMDDLYKKINKALDNSGLSKKTAQGADAGENKTQLTLNTPADSMVSTQLNNATLVARNNINVIGQADNVVKMTNSTVQGAGGGAANGAVGVLDAARNVRNEIASSTVTAGGDISFTTRQGGNSKINAYQGALGGIGAIGIAYSKANSTGDNHIELTNSALKGKNITISALDESVTEVNALGVTVSAGIAGSVMNGQAISTGHVGIKLMKDNTLQAENDVTISAQRKRENAEVRKQINDLAAKDELTEEEWNQGDELYKKVYDTTAVVNAKAMGAAVGFGGAGLTAVARDTGDVSLTIDSRGNNAQTTIQGTMVNISTDNSPHIKAETGTLGVGVIGSDSVTECETSLGTENDHLTTKLTMGYLTKLKASQIVLDNASSPLQNTNMRSLSAAAGASVQENKSIGDAYSDTNLILHCLDIADGADFYAINTNMPDQQITAEGVSASGIVAMGTNKVLNTVNLNTKTFLQKDNTGKLNDVIAYNFAGITTTGKADGSGGAVVDISPDAAGIERKATLENNMKMSGIWQAENVELCPYGVVYANDTLDAVRASIAGGSGLRLHNDLTWNTNLDVTGAKVKTTGRQIYEAKNIHTLLQTQKAGGYGGGAGADSAIENTLTTTATVNLGNSKKSDEQVTISGSDITVRACNDGYILANNEVQGAGLVPILIAKNTGNITVNETVNTANAQITSSDGHDVSISAADDLDYDIEANAVNQGSFIGAASSDNSLKFTRNSKVNLTGKTKIASGRDVSLLAGEDAKGESAKLRMILYANAHNASLIPLKTAPKLVNDTSETHEVTIGREADVESLRHANIRAKSGNEYLEESVREYRIWGSGEAGTRRLTSTALGQNDVGIQRNDSVDVQGKVYAGIHNQLDIDINGDIKMKGDNEIDADSLQITVRQGWFNPNNSLKVVNRENGYLVRYKEIEEAMKGYGQDSKEYKALQAEAAELLQAMADSGFIVKDANGNQGLIVDYPVAALSLGNINVSGGNVYVDTDKFQGKENIITGGAPHVNITNKGNAMLLLGDVKISDNGGRLYENDVLTRHNGGESSITVKSTGNSRNGSKPDIMVQGKIDNPGGKISLINSNNDIFIRGAVNGRSVQVSADKGSLNVSDPEGLANVGRDPIPQYQFDDATSKKIQKKISELATQGKTDLRFKDYNEYRNWLKNTVGLKEEEIQYEEQHPSLGYVAGGNIAITAKNVNINGLLQSGYSRHVIQVSANDIRRIKEEYRKSGDDYSRGAFQAESFVNLSDDNVIGDEKYLVSRKGRVWNSDNQMWDYAEPVYYNPSNGHLLTDTIEAKGGRVNIKGTVASTGNGRIVVTDGAADISIDTSNVQAPLYVGRITNNDRVGTITINDPSKGSVFEYKNGYMRSYKPGTILADNQGWTAYNGNVFNPTSQLYRWTGGTSGQTIMDKSYKEWYSSFFGIKDSYESSTAESTDAIGANIRKVSTVSKTNTGDELMGIALTPYTYNLGSTARDSVERYLNSNKNGITIQSEVHNKGHARRISMVNVSKIHYTNWLHTKGYVTYSWTEIQGNYISTTTSIAADVPIRLGFPTTKGNINIKAGGDIILKENIANAAARDGSKGIGAITLSSDGDIRTADNARLLTDNLNVSGNALNLRHSAIGKQAGINLTADRNNIDFISENGTVAIGKVIINNAATNSKVNIKAKDNIVNGSDNSLIAAPAIKLYSETGNIGTADSLLRVKADSVVHSSNRTDASITAEAQNSIYMQQTEGDMRIANVTSKNGDVMLKAGNGSIVDANGGIETTSDTETLIQRWRQLGIISAKDNASSSAEAAKEAKAARLEAMEYRVRQLAAYDKGDGTLLVDEDKANGYKNAAAAYNQDAGIIAAKAEYIRAIQQAVTEAEQDTARDKLQAAKDAYFKGKGFTDKAEISLIADYGDLLASENYGWSQNEMLFAVQDSIVNSRPGQIEFVKAPNIKGRNITLLAEKGGIGYDDRPVYIRNEDIPQEANMQLLASAKAGDLTWDKDGVTVKRQVPVTLDIADGGTVQLKGRDNVYVSATEDSALNLVGGIDTSGDIRLTAGRGVTLADGTTLRGRNLTIFGGRGSIGSTDKFMELMINGWLNANSGQSIYVYQKGKLPLTILSVAAGMDAYLRADHGFRMVNDYGFDKGYIRAGRTISLFANDGNIAGVRILANGALVNAKTLGGKVNLVNINGELRIGEFSELSDEEIMWKPFASVFARDMERIKAELASPYLAAGAAWISLW